MKAVMETNKLAKEEVQIDLPFLLPLPEQDHAPIQTTIKQWLTVRIVEAWLLLKNTSSYFSEEEERELLEMLEGNEEILLETERIILAKNGELKPNGEYTDEVDGQIDDITSKNIDKSWYQITVNLIQANRPKEIKNHQLPNELIISLTSYPRRFDCLPLTLLSLCNQSVKPDRIILWIAHSDKEQLTEQIKAFEKADVEIRFCEDLKSYKKIIPTLENYPDSYIVTADDDLYYQSNWLEQLLERWKGDDSNVVAHRAHRIMFNNDSFPKPYHTWDWQYRDDITASAYNFPTCGAGVLYPPNIFHSDVTKRGIFTDLAPNADDIWLYWMARLNGTKFKLTDTTHPLIEWPNSNNETLWKDNILKGDNDKQVNNLIQKYGFPKDGENVRNSISVYSANNNFTSSKNYWTNRYEAGGNSGNGSYGQLAQFKAEVINSFTKGNKVNSFIEFGCGDGNQLKYLKLPEYIGYDVSGKAIEICRRKFSKDFKKEFRKMEEYNGEMAECSLSLDVIFHLVEDGVYSNYMCRLFNSAQKFIIIYSSNKDERTASPHVRHRFFTKWIEEHARDWELKEHIPNKHPYNRDSPNTSFCDFYIYEKAIFG
jgi:hypothetical protein